MEPVFVQHLKIDNLLTILFVILLFHCIRSFKCNFIFTQLSYFLCCNDLKMFCAKTFFKDGGECHVKYNGSTARRNGEQTCVKERNAIV